MMEINLAYGRKGLKVNLPGSLDLLSSGVRPGLPDERGALKNAFIKPHAGPSLRRLLKSGQKMVIVHTDITRATPNDRILPNLLAEVEAAGIRREDITLLNGLGTHRRQTETELRAMLGDEIVDRYRCMQHDCYDDSSLVYLGETTAGHPIRINRTYQEADIKILTGFIEPHFFAGFSGGPKAVLPSLAGAESVFTNHGYAMISHPKATWGVTAGNPIWEEMKTAALLTQPDFLLNVSLNQQKEITGIFAGELLPAHAAGCDFVQKAAMVPVKTLYDFVITTNSGYPLDQNLYQSVKGMSAAARITRPGGAIILAAACEDGLPDHGSYGRLLSTYGSPNAFLSKVNQPGFQVQDQWQVQIQAQIQQRAEIYVYSEGLTDQQIRDAWLKPCDDIPALVARLIKEVGPRGCVIPEGPQVIPTWTGK
jgi:nickel-dependent lactate racemase